MSLKTHAFIQEAQNNWSPEYYIIDSIKIDKIKQTRLPNKDEEKNKYVKKIDRKNKKPSSFEEIFKEKIKNSSRVRDTKPQKSIKDFYYNEQWNKVPWLKPIEDYAQTDEDKKRFKEDRKRYPRKILEPDGRKDYGLFMPSLASNEEVRMSPKVKKLYVLFKKYSPDAWEEFLSAAKKKGFSDIDISNFNSYMNKISSSRKVLIGSRYV